MASAIVSLAALLGTIALVMGVSAFLGYAPPKAASERLRELVAGPSSATQESVVKREQAFSQQWLNALETFLIKLITINHLVEQAGLRIPTTILLVVGIACGILGGGLSSILGLPLACTAVCTAGGFLLPFAWLMHRRNSRLRSFSYQLPDALELIARSLRAGHSVPIAMQLVAQETLPPIAVEFEECCRKQSLGMSLGDSINEMLRKVPVDELRFFCTAVRMQQKFGGNLAEILDTISGIVRERFAIMGQVKALTGEGRISGAVLILLPLAAFGGLYATRADYLDPLFTDPLGRKLLWGSIVLQLIGALAIKKIVNIKI